jgi:hypothetical protein
VDDQSLFYKMFLGLFTMNKFEFKTRCPIEGCKEKISYCYVRQAMLRFKEHFDKVHVKIETGSGVIKS